MEEKMMKYKVRFLIFLIVLVVIISIVSFINIWRPKKIVSKSEEQINSYGESTLGRRDFIIRYSDKINSYIENMDFDTLYTYVDPEVIKRENMTVDTLRAYFNKLKVTGNKLTTSNITASSEKIGSNIIAKVDVLTENRAYQASYMIYETSPMNFKIGINNYVYSSQVEKDIIRNQMQMSITKINYGITTATFDLKIKNLGDNPVIYNNDQLEQVFAMRLGTSTVIASSGGASGQRKTIQPSEEVAYTVKYDVEPLSHGRIRGIILAGAVFSDTKDSTDIYFEF